MVLIQKSRVVDMLFDVFDAGCALAVRGAGCTVDCVRLNRSSASSINPRRRRRRGFAPRFVAGRLATKDCT